jgi:Mrp family chromosome partitioning ATPase
MANPIFNSNQDTAIKKIIAVMSSKGGVGKTTVTALLASLCHRQGMKVGILDADITGPSMAKTLGIQTPLVGENKLLNPARTDSGIAFVSSQLLLDKQSDPILWRAPLVLDLIRQFYEDVRWGQLDVLFVDMPPGTGDVSLTVLTSLPTDSIIMVSTPQELVNAIVTKGMELAIKVKKPVLALVENYSYFVCPTCQTQHHLYGQHHGRAVVDTYQIPLYIQLPLRPELATAMDYGKIETIDEAALQPLINLIKEMRYGS